MLRNSVAFLVASSSGLLVSMGVTSVLIAISLVPRLAGRTRSAKHVLLYENLLIVGLLIGNLWMEFGDLIKKFWPNAFVLPPIAAQIFLGVYGILTGIFVGCIAIALAEMLDAIPIFVRRAKLKQGIDVAIAFFALGKTVGVLIMFYNRWMI